MDTKTFYGQKGHNQDVPSDSEDSESEDSEGEDSQEEWIPESGECMSIENDTESVNEEEDEDVAEVGNPSLPRWRTVHNPS
ncbi:hypothetical protein NQZ68_029813 [Dissostichus eleginoides]|nr:hypothetical protein NQZ68_029813 [Dissostichus eleginoides]